MNGKHPPAIARKAGDRVLAATLAAFAAGLLLGATNASASSIAVCASGCPFTQLQPALNAARDGDTVTVGPGTYVGGITITRSVKLAGAGSDGTIISGGGPVITIGNAGAAREPTVDISGVTVTRGCSHTRDGLTATGGGIEIVPNADFTRGATVSIKNSVISGNQVFPSDPDGIFDFFCPGDAVGPRGGPDFRYAAGGGIHSWGDLTLTGSTVANNHVSSDDISGLPALAKAVFGGGIMMERGSLTVENSTLSENFASSEGPNGGHAFGGAIYMAGGKLTVDGSSLTGNAASLTARPPAIGGAEASGGGLYVAEGVRAATISNTTFSDNAASALAVTGDANADSGAVHVADGVNFKLRDSVVTRNRVEAIAARIGRADSGAGEVTGQIKNTQITANFVEASAGGSFVEPDDSGCCGTDAFALAGGIRVSGAKLDNVQITGNHIVTGTDKDGFTVEAEGGGIVVGDLGVSLENSLVSGNIVQTSSARLPAPGALRGGGVYDATVDGIPGLGGPLSLDNTTVTSNSLLPLFPLSAEFIPDILMQGAGVYVAGNTFSSEGNSLVALNSPTFAGQCFGC
jgi:hypothetical protein